MITLQNIGQRQKKLLELLLLSQAGMTVDELASDLNISRNAVTQHLSSMEGYGLVHGTVQSSTGGRPSKRYTLTFAGKEIFPKHYPLFANLLIRLLSNKVGPEILSQYMVELGQSMAEQYQGRINQSESLQNRIRMLAEIMQELGYEARMETNDEGLPEIVASNCVFHKLAAECGAVCDLDTALITSALEGVSVDHRECMVRGGSCCRFSITSKQ